jgi:DNA-3-methyladenine glycosylase II
MTHDWSEPVDHLRTADPILAAVIARVGECRFKPDPSGTHFDALVDAIVSQQLSVKAAATIYKRFLASFAESPPTPAQILATPDEDLRALGLSRQKLTYIKNLAEHVETGLLPIGTIDALEDQKITEALVAVKGIGPWTAQMFLMFRLGRLDVLPDLDLGIQKAVGRAYSLAAVATPKQVQTIGAAWKPYCSIASWYLWRSLDLPDVE